MTSLIFPTGMICWMYLGATYNDTNTDVRCSYVRCLIHKNLLEYVPSGASVSVPVNRIENEKKNVNTSLIARFL
jgi:hypothetical protein